MQAGFLRSGLVAACACFSMVAHAHATAPDQALNTSVKAARTQRPMPQSTPPAIDWPRIQNAYAFEEAHNSSIQTTLLTSTIVVPFASVDIEPLIVADGKLLNDYNKQTVATVNLLNEILATPKQKSDFSQKNYKRAVDLGLMNLDFSQTIKVKWDPKKRIAGNQQSAALVLYSYAYLPIESLLGAHEIDTSKDAKAIDDWLYLWRVLGHGMGIEDAVLPHNFSQATAVVHLLRAYQYPAQNQEIPYQLRALMRNEMNFLYFVKGNGQPIDDPTKLDIRKTLAKQISYSTGLSRALGLGDDPAKGLEQLDRTID